MVTSIFAATSVPFPYASNINGLGWYFPHIQTFCPKCREKLSSVLLKEQPCPSHLTTCMPSPTVAPPSRHSNSARTICLAPQGHLVLRLHYSLSNPLKSLSSQTGTPVAVSYGWGISKCCWRGGEAVWHANAPGKTKWFDCRIQTGGTL